MAEKWLFEVFPPFWGWVGVGAVTNFLDRVYDNKASCKKSAHLDQKWPRNGCFKFSGLFEGGGPFFEILKGYISASGARLGGYDTPLEPS